MSCRMFVLGTGPGNLEQMTPEALAAVAASTQFFGYGPYLDRLTLRADQTRHASDNREELDRAGAALALAARGADVCVVSGGDPGVFAMAAAVCPSNPVPWASIILVESLSASTCFITDEVDPACDNSNCAAAIAVAS